MADKLKVIGRSKLTVEEHEIKLTEKNILRALPFNTISVDRKRITVLRIIDDAFGKLWQLKSTQNDSSTNE